MKNTLFGLAAVAALSLTLMTGCPSGGGSTGGSASGTATSTATTTATTTAPMGGASGTASSTASSTAPAGGASGSASGAAKTGATTSTMKVASVAGFDPKATFQQKCAGCHGANGGGGMCPSLIGVSKRRSDSFIVHRITVGSAEKGMPAFGKQLTADQIKAMASYVKTL